jgi:putative ABC transport system ATP-binding protein
MQQSIQLSVRCEGVVKRYPTGTTVIHALDGVNLAVRKGELLILAGPSGCGKTTLISVIAGILNQDEGICEVEGHHIKKLTEAEKLLFRAQNIGFVFQQFNLIPTLTVAENVAVPLIINGLEREMAFQKARELLTQVGLGERSEDLPSQLSGGQQQRVAIARAMIHNPQLIVCDEPTSSLDGETGQKIMTLLKELTMKGDCSLIVVTHDSRILKFADRIAKMLDGKITEVTEGPQE